MTPRRPKPQLGLVCQSAGDRVRFRALTRARFLGIPESERAGVLRELYADNLQRVLGGLHFCGKLGIRLYRLSSALFPFSDEPVGERVLARMEPELRLVGELMARTGMRLVMHPDQFVVLNSERPSVVANSVKILRAHAMTLDLMGLPRSPWCCMEIHGGKGGRPGELVEEIATLPENIRRRIALENDERTYGADAILAICRRAGVPMVFDAHHHVVHEKVDSYDHPSVARALRAAAGTWPRRDWQLVHISNGRTEFGDPRHHDLIATMPAAYRNAPWIEVEAKGKEEAILRLMEEWSAKAA